MGTEDSMKKESYVKNERGQVVGKHVTWTGAGRTNVYRTYTNSRTPKQHLGDITHHGKRSSWSK
jgi:hypothetical protein